MSNIIKISKPIIIKYQERETKLSKELKEKIEEFWKKAVEENPKRPYLSNLINEIVRERGNEND